MRVTMLVPGESVSVSCTMKGGMRVDWLRGEGLLIFPEVNACEGVSFASLVNELFDWGVFGVIAMNARATVAMTKMTAIVLRMFFIKEKGDFREGIRRER